MPELRLWSLKLTPIEMDRSTAKFDLGLNLWETEGAARLARLQHGSVRRGDRAPDGRALRAPPRSGCGRPRPAAGELPLPDEARRASTTPAHRRRETRAGASIARFEAQARGTPDAMAVIFGRRLLTYGELNARPTGWRTGSAVSASAPRRSWRSASSVRRRCWSGLLGILSRARLRPARPRTPARALAVLHGRLRAHASLSRRRGSGRPAREPGRSVPARRRAESPEQSRGRCRRRRPGRASLPTSSTPPARRGAEGGAGRAPATFEHAARRASSSPSGPATWCPRYLDRLRHVRPGDREPRSDGRASSPPGAPGGLDAGRAGRATGRGIGATTWCRA